jgi:hypothetical protein
MKYQSRNSREQGGFVMVLVLLLLSVLLSAGMFGLKMLESDTRSFRRFNRDLFVGQAASAGAAQRMAQIETSKNDPMSAFNVNVDWTSWPNGATAGVNEFDLANRSQFAATSIPTLSASKPPGGQQVGSAAGQTIIWEIRSTSIPTNIGAGGNETVTFGGEHGVIMGVKLVTSGSQSYNMD